ncbi:hypothetical protein [Leifsonia sp. Leaf264]|uniref:hypothetical protein n=1 Tax=Leifsonia sp. Leaf264 TaxID=1736314 RepID=UPI0006FE2A74|nr:hypothetical protein [Leifsonia sp. Leaf264]KQO98177.1 hypothetical protein ASF30_08945 [Leifsonia sp. Leaf264]
MPHLTIPAGSVRCPHPQQCGVKGSHVYGSADADACTTASTGGVTLTIDAPVQIGDRVEQQMLTNILNDGTRIFATRIGRVADVDPDGYLVVNYGNGDSSGLIAADEVVPAPWTHEETEWLIEVFDQMEYVKGIYRNVNQEKLDTLAANAIAQREDYTLEDLSAVSGAENAFDELVADHTIDEEIVAEYSKFVDESEQNLRHTTELTTEDWNRHYAFANAQKALLIRPHIGTAHGLTQRGYDLLVKPWASTFDVVHPDDTPPS